MKRLWLLLPFLLVSCVIRPTSETAEPVAHDIGSTTPTMTPRNGAGAGPTFAASSPTATPERVQISWSSIGPGGGGWLPSMAFAPPNTLFVGCDVGGAYRSKDGGETFEIINDGLQNYVVQAIAVHRQDPSIVYLGTGGGLYRSKDGGDHWE
jgi:hypothetical protein